MDDILAFLTRHPLFAGLERPALVQIARCMHARPMARGQQILLEEEPTDTAFFIAHGQVRIYRLSPSGREQALADLLPGQSFNLVSAIDGKPAPASAAARTDGMLYTLSRADLARFMHAYPSLCRNMASNFAGRLRHLTSLVEELALHSVAQRLARLLLRMANGEAEGRFTQQEMANRLGTVREVVSRTLRDFQDRGLIRIERQRIIVVNQEGLADVAAGL